MRALPSFSLSTLGQLAGPHAIWWLDFFCRVGRHPRQELSCSIFQRRRQQPSFTYGMTNRCSASTTSTFRSSFRACRADFQSRPLLHRDNLRHSAKNRAIGIRRTFVTSDSIYLIIYGISAPNRFCIITEWRFIRGNR